LRTTNDEPMPRRFFTATAHSLQMPKVPKMPRTPTEIGRLMCRKPSATLARRAAMQRSEQMKVH